MNSQQRPTLAEWVAWVERAGGRWATDEELADAGDLPQAGSSVPKVSSRDSEEKTGMGSYGHNAGRKGG